MRGLKIEEFDPAGYRRASLGKAKPVNLPDDLILVAAHELADLPRRMTSGPEFLEAGNCCIVPDHAVTYPRA